MIKIFCMVKGWGDLAAELASESNAEVFPSYYFKALEHFNVFEFDKMIDETNLKADFPDIVWLFDCIPFAGDKPNP